MNSLNATQQKVVLGLGVVAVGAILASYVYKRSSGPKVDRTTKKSAKKGKKGEKTKESSKGDKEEKKEEEEEEEEDVLAKVQRMKDEGNSAFKAGNYEKAIYYYTEGLALSQVDNHLLYSNRSAAYAAIGKFEQSMEDAMKCIELNPEWSKGYFRMGKALLATGKFEDAFINFYKGLKFDPKNEDLKKVMLQARQELGMGDLDSRSKVDQKMIEMYFKRKLGNFCTEDMGTDLETVEKIIKDAAKEKKAETILETNQVLKDAYEKNPLSTLRVIIQLLLDEGQGNAALTYAEKAMKLSSSTQTYAEKLNNTSSHNTEDAQIIQLYTSAMLRSASPDITKVLENIRKAFKLDSQDVLISHTLASVLLRLSQNPQMANLNSKDIREILKELQSALTNPNANQLLIADCGIRLWFKLFEDPVVQNMLMKEEQENMQNKSSLNEAYLKGLTKGAFSKLVTDPFFMQALSQIVFNNPGLERVLCPFRTAFASLEYDDGQDQFEQLSALIYAMDLQCFRNNYLYNVTEEDEKLLSTHLDSISTILDKKSAEHLVEDGVLDKELGFHLAIVALYQPLHTVPGVYDIISKVDLTKTDERFATLLKKAALNQTTESEYKKDLEFKSKTPITSSPVLDFYNSHVVGSWDSAGVSAGRMVKITMKQEMDWIFPNYKPLIDLEKRLKLLIAGCGSGSEIAQISTVYENIDVVGLDFSAENLAYAKRQNQELGFNAEYVLADVMQLEEDSLKEDELFDIVMANGLLNHLGDPLKGLEKLLNVLKPGGILRLSVMNKRSVEFVGLCRRFLADKFKRPLFDNSSPLPKVIRTPTVDEIRQARNFLIESEQQEIEEEIMQIPGFYSLHEFNELIFNPQLTSFSFSTIGEYLDRLGLKLIGFEFPQILQETILSYRCDYPEDPDLKDFDKLEEFSTKFPDAFRNITNSIILTCEKPL